MRNKSSNSTMMRLRFLFLPVTLLLFSQLCAQLRIDPSGRVGIGWNWPNPGYKLHLKGDALLTTYPEVPSYPGNTFIELKMKLGNGQPGVEIGTNVDKIAFWSTETGWNKIYVEWCFTESDSSHKQNIRKVPNALAMIKALNAYKYEMKGAGVGSTRYGLMAQEMREIIPEATDSAKGTLMVDYSQVIPLLVEALKQSVARIDSLTEAMTNMQERLGQCCDQSSNAPSGANDVRNNGAIGNRLFQNRPNPFSERTVIEYEVHATNGEAASIMVFDLNGAMKLQVPVAAQGKGTVELRGNQLAPGMYLYTLVLGGKEIETKRMILTE